MDGSRARARSVDDVAVAALLAGRALVEIRFLAGNRPSWNRASSENLDRIRSLADLAHNMPGIASGRGRRPGRRGLASFYRRRGRGRARPMSWTWNTAGPEGQALMLQWIDEAGYRWTPPPPLTDDPPRRTLRQRVSVLTGWPVRTPPGRMPLPRKARRLKALDSDAVCSIVAEAERLQLSVMCGDESWHRAHLSSEATHYLVPDPAPYHWPDSSGDRPVVWWQCWLVLTMVDDEQVRTRIAVMPETFAALSDNVPRHRQHRLLHEARDIQRDAYVWRRLREVRQEQEER